MADNIQINGNTEQQVADAVSFAKLVKNTFGRSSLTRMSQSSIAQFPVVMSADVPLDDAMVIAKGLEAQYAAMLVGTISMNSDYDRKKYPNPADYLKTFHDNGNIPDLFRSMDSQLEGAMAIECSVATATLYDLGRLTPKEVMEAVTECWGNTQTDVSPFNTGSLNATYTPHAHTQAVMESVVHDLRQLHAPAMEASGGSFMDTVRDYNKHGTVSPDNLGNAEQRVSPKSVKTTGPDGKDRFVVRTEMTRKPQITGKQEIVKNQKAMADLEPTLINLQLNSHAGGNGAIITHNVVFGVKTKVQAIPQDAIIEGLIGGAKGSRKIFNFIRWTEGDYRLVRDGIFGFDRAKTDAVANRDIRDWLNAIRARRRSNGYAKALTGQSMPPITTVVVTSYEIARVAEATGIDLSQAFNAAKLIYEYYMLGFIIVDTETGTLSCMFDGDTKFFQTSVNALKQKQKSSNETDLTQFAAFMRALGR